VGPGRAARGRCMGGVATPTEQSSPRARACARCALPPHPERPELLGTVEVARRPRAGQAYAQQRVACREPLLIHHAPAAAGVGGAGVGGGDGLGFQAVSVGLSHLGCELENARNLRMREKAAGPGRRNAASANPYRPLRSHEMVFGGCFGGALPADADAQPGAAGRPRKVDAKQQASLGPARRVRARAATARGQPVRPPVPPSSCAGHRRRAHGHRAPENGAGEVPDPGGRAGEGCCRQQGEDPQKACGQAGSLRPPG
jgi:hypothetical protein